MEEEEEEESSSRTHLDDIENLGSQNPATSVWPRQTCAKTHVLIVKQRRQENYGSDDYEISVHRLYLSPGENALILKHTTSPSVLMDTQEDPTMMISYIVSFERTAGEFIVTSDRYLYFDVTSDHVVTIKDFRAPPSCSSSDGSRDDHHSDVDSHANNRDSFPRVGIASQDLPSHFEELPLRQLRILVPGDRISTNLGGDQTRGDFILEYRFLEDRPKTDHHDPYSKHLVGLLTQPQDDDDDDDDDDKGEEDINAGRSETPPSPRGKTQSVGRAVCPPSLGSPPRHPDKDISASLSTQPYNDNDSEENDASRSVELCSTYNVARKTLQPPMEEIQHGMDHDDEDSEQTVEMTQHAFMKTTQGTTNSVLSTTINEDFAEDDSETTLGYDDQRNPSIEIHPLESVILDRTQPKGETVTRSYTDTGETTEPTAAAAAAETEEFRTIVPAVDNPRDDSKGCMAVNGEPSIRETSGERTDRAFDCVDSKEKATNPEHSSNDAENVDTVVVLDRVDQTQEGKREDASNVSMRNSVPGAEVMEHEDDPRGDSRDRLEDSTHCQLGAKETTKDDLVLSPDALLGEADILESSRESQSLHGLGCLSQSQTQPKKGLVVDLPAVGNLVPPHIDAWEAGKAEGDATNRMEETQLFSPSDTVSQTVQLGCGRPKYGAHSSNDPDASSHNLHQSNPQEVLMPLRNILAPPSQDISLSLLRETGVETPDATLDDCQNMSTHSDDDVEKAQHNSDDKPDLKMGGEVSSNAEASKGVMAVGSPCDEDIGRGSECIEEMKRPNEVEDTATGCGLDFSSVANTIETDTKQSAESTVPVGGGRSQDGNNSDEFIVQEQHDLPTRVDKKGSPSRASNARKLTNAEAHEIAKFQMTPDKERVKCNLENKAKLDEELARKQQISENRQDSLQDKDNEQRPPRPSKRPAEDEFVSPTTYSAVKRRRTSCRTSTPDSSRKSVATLESTPRSTRTTRESPQGFSGKSHESKQISLMGTQVSLDQEMIKKLGGNLYENIGDASKATHLIIDVKDDGKPKLIRTPKFMIAVARGCDIVHVNFYKDSINKNKFQDEEKYYLWNMTDIKVKSELKAFEKKYKFKLKESVARARQLRQRDQLLLTGIKVYICPGVAGRNDSDYRTPVVSEFRAILEGAGGTVIKTFPESLERNQKAIIITSKIEKEATKQKKATPVKQALENRNVVVMTTVEVFDAIMSQILPL